jgi:hypothetical protein
LAAAVGIAAAGAYALYVIRPPAEPDSDATITERTTQIDPSGVRDTTDAVATLGSAEVVVVRTPRLSAKTVAEREAFDPRRDGWDTEAFVERTDAFWKLMRDRLAHHSSAAEMPEKDPFASRIADDLVSTTLRPGELASAYSDGPLVVRKFQPASGKPSDERRGAAGLAAAMDDLAARFAACPDAHAHTKTIRVEATDARIETTTLIEIAGHAVDRAIQAKLTCRVEWTDGGESPRLRSLAAALGL